MQMIGPQHVLTQKGLCTALTPSYTQLLCLAVDGTSTLRPSGLQFRNQTTQLPKFPGESG